MVITLRFRCELQYVTIVIIRTCPAFILRQAFSYDVEELIVFVHEGIVFIPDVSGVPFIRGLLELLCKMGQIYSADGGGRALQ